MCFSNNKKVLSVLNFCLKAYLIKKGLSIEFNNKSIESLYSGFLYSSLYFLKSSNLDIFVEPTSLYINLYKCKLKMIIKNSYQVSITSLIKNLNVQIKKWYIDLHFSGSSLFIPVSLDFYLYKLLWKYCKRMHPRRGNLWIFQKYWKNFSGTFRFFTIDSLSGKFYFLDSHLCLNESFNTLPFSISIFDLRDKKKLYCDYFRKMRSKIYGIYGLLFDIQKGVCPCCNRLFLDYNLNNFRIYDLSNFVHSLKDSSANYRFVLVHASCLCF